MERGGGIREKACELNYDAHNLAHLCPLSAINSRHSCNDSMVMTYMGGEEGVALYVGLGTRSHLRQTSFGVGNK